MVPACDQSALDEARRLDALSVGADRSEKGDDVQAHCGSPFGWLAARDRGASFSLSILINSPRDHAWNGQPRGVNGGSASAISDTCPSPASRRCAESGSKKRRLAWARDAAVLPWTRSHASTNGPISHGHTVPWW